MFRATSSELSELRNTISVFDPLDSAAKMAALQLVPENADRLVRIYGATAVAASVPSSPGGRPGVSASRLRRILNEPPLSESAFASGEDPFNNPFAEIMIFHGGSHMVFPGVDDDASFVFRHLAKAVFGSDEQFSTPEFEEEARALCSFVLALSDEVATRAGLDRRVQPVSGAQGPVFTPTPEAIRNIVESAAAPPQEIMSAAHLDLRNTMAPPGFVIVPASGNFNVLREAVTFSEEEIRGLLARAGASPPILDSLTLTQGAVELDSVGPNDHPLFTKPLLHDGGGRYVVAMPRDLVFALCNALVRLAIDYGVEEEVASQYLWAVYFNVEQSLEFMGDQALLLRKPDPAEPFVFEGLFGLDRDKWLHVLLTTDDLQHYDTEGATSGWTDGAGLSDRLHARLLDAEARILGQADAPNDVLHLVLVQGIQPGVTWADGVSEGLVCPVTMMSVSDLEVIALLEGRDQLALWKYARAYRKVRERRPVHRLSTQMDEYHHYRRYGHSYYFSDDFADNPLMIPMGGAGALRREVQRERDFRGVRYTDPDLIVEVSALYDDGNVPIYAPWRGGRPGQDGVELLLEALPVDVWVVGPETVPEPRYHSVYFHFADMIAYWLWQFAPGLNALLGELAEHRHQVQVHLDLMPSDGWFDPNATAAEPPVECEVDAETNLRVRLRSEAARMLSTPDNAGERTIMREVLRGIRTLQAESVGSADAGPTDDEIEGLLQRYAPLGLKKKLLFMSGDRSIAHREEGLPSHRGVQSADEHELLDELGAHLSGSLGVRRGPIPDDQRTEVLRETVGFYFRELERLVSTLSSEDLLETLLRHHERILHEREQQDLLIPTRIACFSSEEAMVETLRGEKQELNKAALASRFLIEYVAARPPRGLRLLSLSVYDRLMALSSEIINKGMISDAIRFGIADLKLEMLRSGRLGIGEGTYGRARERFLGVHLAGEIYRSTANFARHWREVGRAEKPELADKMDAAARAEFGLSLTELNRFLGEAANVGLDRDGEPKTMLLGGFLDEMQNNLGWDRVLVEQAFEVFASRPRDDFLSPPAPLDAIEVYPWRFSRALSYLRRPLLVRPTKDGDDVVWGVRHCLDSASHLIDLCVGGRLKARSSEMKEMIGELHVRNGEEFNDAVADVYEGFEGWVVRRRVEKVAGHRIERAHGQTLGDVDVLAADPKRRVLWAVEAKDLAFARNPAELANELANTFQTRGSKRAAVDKHLERAAWLRDNLFLTLGWLGIPGPLAKKRWRVEPLVVVDHELQSPFVVQAPAPVVPLRELGSWHSRRR